MWRRMTLVVLMMAGSSGCAVAGAESQSVRPEVHLFLLAGQSNMAGRGEMTPDRREPIPGVMALRQDGTWGPAVDPLHWDKSVAGVGLARSFAQAYLRDNPGVVVGFIPAACGGSPIEVWQPRAYFAQTQSYPYDDAILRTRRAQALSGGRLKGILWHQGESDAQPERAARYRERLEALMGRFRADLGEADLPIVIGQLGRFGGGEVSESRATIDGIHRAVAAGDARIGFAEATGLTANPDLIHFDAESLDAFGARYAKVWAELRRGPPGDSGD